MNPSRSSLQILSFLDARVITGPTRGLIHLARYLPTNAWLHIAVLTPTHGGVVPDIVGAAGPSARLTVHRLYERGSYDPTVIARAASLARDIDAHVIQSHSYKPHVIALAVRALTRTPWIGFHHGWTAENLKVRLFHAIDHVTLPRADRIVTVSRRSERLVLDAGCPAERTVVIPNAVDAMDLRTRTSRDAARAALGLPNEPCIASAVGRLSHEKGQDVLLAAFARTAALAPQLAIALAGDGPDRALLERRAHELGIGSRVHFLGHQPDVARVYAASDIVVLPSRSEGMPNALLEAMASGVAVVATDVGGVTEVARDGDSAWIVAPEDPGALSHALLEAAGNPVERSRRAANAHRFTVESLSPRARAARFAELYRHVLDGAWHPRESGPGVDASIDGFAHNTAASAAAR